jgi:formate hydrogenlyase subunit 3/multisubunit Na+/H+ antiporter MnhD subunit
MMVLEFLPAIVVIAAALLVFLLDVVGVKRLEALGGVVVVGLSVSLVLVLADLGWAPVEALRTIPASQVDVAANGASLVAYSSLGFIFQAIFLISALLVAVASLSRDSREKGGAIFYGLLALATAGMLLAAVAADLLFLLLAIEIGRASCRERV